jgi:hypothetical protein
MSTENSAILISGKITYVGAKEQKSEKLTVQKVWIETMDKYPQTIEIQFNNKDFNGLVGDTGVFSINLRGRSWTNSNNETKVFNTLECWKFDID